MTDAADAAGRAKAAHAFRTIREVSDAVGVPPHILRFWETRFPQLKPIQRGGNRRYYRPVDVALAHALHGLLHGQGYTVKGVQKLIASEGLAAVVARGNPNPADASGQALPALSTDAVARHAPDEAGPMTAALIPAAMIGELRAIRDRLAAALAA